MSIERTIQKAKILETGEIIEDLNKYFDDRKSSFKIRQEHNRNNISFQCLNCEQKLTIAQSNKNNIYLKHLPNSNYCELKDENLPNRELDLFNNILASKESDRHIFLKNRIGELLKNQKDVSNVRIDDHFIFNEKGKKRRPDVYCKYLDKEIVFEIQLSQLSQRYILGRNDFYKEKGIYLIWILDNFDVRGNTATELDIKHLSQHQNYFRFKDEANYFKLKCEYKYTYLDPVNNQFQDKWNVVFINLDKLKFDNNNVEVYFHNFQKEKDDLELIQKRNLRIIEKKRLQKEKQKEKDRAVYKIDEFLNDIAKEKSKGYYSDFRGLKSQLRGFNELELDLINNRLNLGRNTKIFDWVKNATREDFNFIEFILDPFYFDFDINRVDNYGNSLFYYLYTNEDIPYIHNKERFLKTLFDKKYRFSKKDEVILKSYLADKNLNDSYIENRTLYTIANSTPKWLIEKLFEERITKVIFIIESFLQKKLIGFKYSSNEWLRLADNSIQHYPEYWTYILSAVKYSNLYHEILKGNLKMKINNFSFTDQKEDRDFNQLFMYLYPELIHI